jgi:stage II sporulation protein D
MRHVLRSGWSNVVITLAHEPTVCVGLMSGVQELSFALDSEFATPDGTCFTAGAYRAAVALDRIAVYDHTGRRCAETHELSMRPRTPVTATFTIRGVTIGLDFHWQRQEDQQFHGTLRLKRDTQGRLLVLNEIGVEAYLTSVIASEMSATSPLALLKAHAIISRSWLLAQLLPWKIARVKASAQPYEVGDERHLIRWYDQESHTEFDVCADDHCQRYQGIAKATAPAVLEAIHDTTGQVLVYDEALCDARFSKSCGGMTEAYAAAWEDRQVPYLTARYDGDTFPAGFSLPLTDEANAARWILGAPEAFCHTTDHTMLARVLPSFDQETVDFYRWRVTLAQAQAQELLRTKLGLDVGPIHRLEPVARGASGRLVRLRIVGERETCVIGKELEIRRALSSSHLYSAAFVVQPKPHHARVPEHFTLIGAGWGHGVGLCQIGAALMAARGYAHEHILAHYYTGATLHTLYRRTP